MNNSIIIPAYNESKRIISFLTALIRYCKKHLKNYEIIVVNDGSKDNTVEVVKQIIKKNSDKNTKIIGYEKNRGKGGAVEYGVEHAKGNKILFIDADGSIQPNEIPRMLEELDKYDVVFGDRLSKKSKVEKKIIRNITSTGFNTIVSLLFQYRYCDNLCGFKGFKKNIAKTIFKNLIDKRWVFDVELIYKAKKKKYDIYFMPIAWKETKGSRINLFLDPIKWFLRLIRLRIKLIGYK